MINGELNAPNPNSSGSVGRDALFDQLQVTEHPPSFTHTLPLIVYALQESLYRWNEEVSPIRNSAAGGWAPSSTAH